MYQSVGDGGGRVGLPEPLAFVLDWDALRLPHRRLSVLARRFLVCGVISLLEQNPRILDYWREIH